MHPSKQRLIYAAAAVFVSACSPESPISPVNFLNPSAIDGAIPGIASSATKGPWQVLVGESVTLVASSNVRRSRIIKWTISDPGVASVTSSGVVTGITDGSTTVTASGTNNARDQFTVNVTSPVTSVDVGIPSTSMSVGGSMTATSTARSASGALVIGRTVSWETSSGTALQVSASGVITALATGTQDVRATVDGVVGVRTITVGAPAVTSFTLSPKTGGELTPGQTRQYSTAAVWPDLGSRAYNVSYTATGGTISMTGLYIAGQLAGTFLVTATCDCGKADSAFVTVDSVTDNGQLMTLAISPKTATLDAGATRQFSATANWSTGATTLPPIAYSATGGSVTSAGLYTAPTAPGTYRVIVAHTGGSLRDTAVVTVPGVVVPPPPYTGVFGPGRNAPAWSGKTVYPEELFNTPVPVHYAGANAAGFKGWQGFDGAWGTTYLPTRVAYPVVGTPLGTKRVLEVTFPGSSQNFSAPNSSTASWPTNQAWAVGVTGSWSGTLIFERSRDGFTWAPVTLRGVPSQSGSQTNVNGVWVSDDALTIDGGLFRVRAASWGGGTATVAVGMQGGAAAARMSGGNFIGNPTRIYTRTMVYVDPNWTNGGNVGTKFFFFSSEQGNGHYTGVIGGIDNEGNGSAFVGLQAGTSRNIPGVTSVRNGTWMDVEFLFVANSAGVANGVARAWVNGVESINAQDLLFFAAGKVPGFSYLFLDPTYGGGEAPPPRNVFFRIAGWYRESAP